MPHNEQRAELKAVLESKEFVRAPAFARPHTNSPALRANDSCARAMLCAIRERKQS